MTRENYCSNPNISPCNVDIIKSCGEIIQSLLDEYGCIYKRRYVNVNKHNIQIKYYSIENIYGYQPFNVYHLSQWIEGKFKGVTCKAVETVKGYFRVNSTTSSMIVDITSFMVPNIPMTKEQFISANFLNPTTRDVETVNRCWDAAIKSTQPPTFR